MARVWIGNFKGPKGDKGDKGDVGPQGPMGPQGPVGLVNSEGAVEFEDYTSAETVLPTAEEALDGIVSGSSLKGILGSIKAFCKNILSVGMASSELIGDAFSLERPYSAGEYVIKDNVMYRFTTDKEAGEWDETVVEPTKMAVEVQALSANIPFSFGIDANGNYGYIKEGADSVIPFKSLSGLKCWNPGNIVLSAQQSTSRSFAKPEGVTEIIIIYMVSSTYSGPAISYTKNCINNEKTILGWSHGQAGYYGASTYVIAAQTIYDAGNITFTIRSMVPSGGTSMSQCSIVVLY